MILKLSTYPDPVLRQKAVPVELIDSELRQLASDMLDTMYASKGVGLAAPQVGVSKRLIVIDASEEHNQPCAFINPEILKRSGKDTCEEGCLSVPGVNAEVTRAARVVVLTQLLNGEELQIDADGLLARAFQHEIDHLDGILFTDKVRLEEAERVKYELQDMAEEKAAGKLPGAAAEENPDMPGHHVTEL